jgi:hypothetical protein
MKTSFSMKVTGSITVSIEPSNGGGGAGTGANDSDDDGDNVLFDALLAPYMKSLMDDAVKKYVHNEGITAEEEEEEEDDDDANGDLCSPLPQRRIPVDADDSVEEEEGSVEEDEDDDDEAGDLPNVHIEYQYADDNSLSQKMNTLNLRRRH